MRTTLAFCAVFLLVLISSVLAAVGLVVMLVYAVRMGGGL